MAAKDESGSRFGCLTVIARSNNRPDGTATWQCICDCGNERILAGTALRSGRSVSCGCRSPKFTTDSTSTHGMSRSRTYKIWLGMKARCSDGSTGKSRRLYFDKGIRVCERWCVFEQFLADMGEAPSGKSIDRIDGLGNYEPANCRWATSKEQGNNTASNVVLELDGKSMTVSMWAREVGVKVNTLVHRLRRGIPADRAIAKTMEKKHVNAF